jgi:ketosteroid isomerase-like protein
VAAYGGALLTGFYAALDRQDWAAATALLTADVRWHVLGNDQVDAVSVVGREAVGRWLARALGEFEAIEQTLTAVHDEGTAAAVFTATVLTRGGLRQTSAWLDSFRFEEGLIAEHVSLQIG